VQVHPPHMGNGVRPCCDLRYARFGGTSGFPPFAHFNACPGRYICKTLPHPINDTPGARVQPHSQRPFLPPPALLRLLSPSSSLRKCGASRQEPTPTGMRDKWEFHEQPNQLSLSALFSTTGLQLLLTDVLVRVNYQSPNIPFSRPGCMGKCRRWSGSAGSIGGPVDGE
jgi:hypothetical protein